MLRLEITWLSGTAWLTRDPSNPEPDWPPQPDRIFSALVASWGLGGEDAAERAAIECLEGLQPPGFALLTDAAPRQTATVYVPPNDSRHEQVLPNRRKRQPRSFPAVTLDVDAPVHLSLSWDTHLPFYHRQALDALARRTSYLGHSSSLVRMRFVENAATKTFVGVACRTPYPGRLAELEDLHHRHMKGETFARPRPSTRTGNSPPRAVDARPFSDDPSTWVVFEHAAGDRPNMRSASVLCDHLRRAMMEAWTRANGTPAPGWITGHEPDGTPARDAHLAVVPLANVGWEHSDGRLMGVALVPPRKETEAWERSDPEAFARRQAFRRAFGRLGETDADSRSVLTLAPRRGSGTWSWRLAPAASGARALDPMRYLRPSHLWASVTPVVLDRHPKAKGVDRRAEIEQILRDACTRTGLPEPTQVHAENHAALRGVPSAWSPGSAPDWTGWSRKKSFGARPLLHVRLAFAEPVAGPILIGAGRFVGLGLFLPMREANG